MPNKFPWSMGDGANPLMPPKPRQPTPFPKTDLADDVKSRVTMNGIEGDLITGYTTPVSLAKTFDFLTKTFVLSSDKTRVEMDVTSDETVETINILEPVEKEDDFEPEAPFVDLNKGRSGGKLPMSVAPARLAAIDIGDSDEEE